ncbi:hypothetical protein BH20ACI4_BH20ACI4_07060 [soil metagenome]
MKECQLCKKCYTDEVSTCPDDGLPTFHSLSGEPVLEGKYRLDRRLGQGGMGVVYCAKHAYLKTQHAIKIILPDLVGNDPQLVTRFRQEALAAAAIRHHNVVQVTDYGVAQGTMPFLVMEYVEGESLHDMLAREKKLSPEQAFELMSAICAGIGVAHKQGIVHRDLKPLNIMLVKDSDSLREAVKVLDFGLAKIKSGELLGSFIQAQTTGLMGSPYYMAPEQWSDEDPDGRADIYSLAVMLFQMLTGDVPFKGSSIPAIMKKHLTDPPTTFAEMGANVSPEIEKVVRHALEKDPEKRTPTVEKFVEELKDAIGLNSQSVGMVSATHHPVSGLRILTNPPQAKVFIDNVAIGESQSDGWLILDGLQTGSHHLTIRHAGYKDWENNVVCDGSVQQVVAKLEKSENLADNFAPDSYAIPKPPVPTLPGVSPDTPSQTYNQTQAEQISFHQTNRQNFDTGNQNAVVESKPKPKSAIFSPLVLAIIGIAGLFLLTTVGIGAAILLGLIDFGGTNGNQVNNATPTPTASPVEKDSAKPELVQIPGGTFRMGRSDGEILERPENDVTVGDFYLGKTEVTNGEYYEFIQDAQYTPVPLNWEKAKPLESEMDLPVRYVSIKDAEAFIKWRSGKDNLNYRLPTEEEWEFAARNGSKNNLYPWGDTWDKEKANIDVGFNFAKVGSRPDGQNDWKVQDLIGNVWEWTSSKASSYKGTDPQIAEQVETAIEKAGKNVKVVRGSFDVKKGVSTATSTFRGFAPETQRDKVIGFRLARSN